MVSNWVLPKWGTVFSWISEVYRFSYLLLWNASIFFNSIFFCLPKFDLMLYTIKCTWCFRVTTFAVKNRVWAMHKIFVYGLQNAFPLLLGSWMGLLSLATNVQSLACKPIWENPLSLLCLRFGGIHCHCIEAKIKEINSTDDLCPKMPHFR